MEKVENRADDDNLVLRARTQADALGRLYEMYYERVFRFCVHRLFNKQIAEDLTSTIFLQVARKINTFAGQTQTDFRNWLYAIAANHTNAYIRKTLRRKQLFAEAAASMTTENTSHQDEPDWPTLYSAILKLKPQHQTIITLRFFEDLGLKQIAEIINAKEATVRVTLHRIIKKLRNHLQTNVDGGT